MHDLAVRDVAHRGRLGQVAEVALGEAREEPAAEESNTPNIDSMLEQVALDVEIEEDFENVKINIVSK